MKIVKKVAVSTKNFVQAHKTGFALATGLVIGVGLSRGAVREHDNFLKEHGLFDEFYTAEG